MQHVHYDLAQIEHGTREMFAQAPAEAISDNPDLVAIFRRSVEIEVQATKFFLNEIMRGTNPADLLQTFEMILVNLILNHTAHFTPPDSGECLVCELASNVAARASEAHHDEDRKPAEGAGVAISPVTSGHA